MKLIVDIMHVFPLSIESVCIIILNVEWLQRSVEYWLLSLGWLGDTEARCSFQALILPKLSHKPKHSGPLILGIFKGLVHSKIVILSLSTHPQVWEMLQRFVPVNLQYVF